MQEIDRAGKQSIEASNLALARMQDLEENIGQNVRGMQQISDSVFSQQQNIQLLAAMADTLAMFSRQNQVASEEMSSIATEMAEQSDLLKAHTDFFEFR